MIESTVEQTFKCNECGKLDEVVHVDVIEELKPPKNWFKMGIGQHFCSPECYRKAFDKIVEEKRQAIEEEIKLSNEENNQQTN